MTKDGKTIRIYCNIGSPEDVHAVQVNDGGGIGLFRSEFLYLNTSDYPTEDQQFEAYKQVLSDMDGRRSSSARWTSALTSRSATLICRRRITPPWVCALCASA